MKTYAAGAPARGGTYMNLSTGQFVSVEATDTARLPAVPEAKYVRVPIGMVLVLGPLMGLAYIIFLPLAGIVGLAVVGVQRIRGGLASLNPGPAKE